MPHHMHTLSDGRLEMLSGRQDRLSHRIRTMLDSAVKQLIWSGKVSRRGLRSKVTSFREPRQ